MVNWMSVRSMLTKTIIRELHNKSVDFVLDYTQSDVKTEIFMEILLALELWGNTPYNGSSD